MNCFLRLSRIRPQMFLNKSNILFRSPFCSMIEPLEVENSIPRSESPLLPEWIKSGDSVLQESKDDDFVLPSLKFWIESDKISTQINDPAIQMTDIGATDVDRICGMLKEKHFESVSDVILALNEFSINVTEDLLEQILERFCFDWILSVGSFRWVESRIGRKCSPAMYNRLISNLAKSRKFDLIWEIVEEMMQLEGYVSLDTMLIIIRRFAKAGMHEEALRVFRTLETYRVAKNIRVFNLLIDTLSKNRGMELVESVYLEFKDVFAPTMETFNIMINGWCRFRKIPKAEKALEEMKKHGFEPDVVTYTSFIDAYCREKDFRKVDDTLDYMLRREGLKPTVVTYTIIIKALGRAKETKKSLDVYEKAKENGVTPDASLYTALLTNLSKSGRLNDAREVFQDMEKQGIAPDSIAYNAMIAAAVNHTREEEALTLLKTMEEKGCKPDFSTYSPLLKLCCRLKRMTVLNFLLSHMFKNNVSLDLGSYALLINRLCANGSSERACAFFEEMVKRGFVPTSVMYTKLVEWLEKNGMNEKKDHIEKLMQEALSDNSEKRAAEVF